MLYFAYQWYIRSIVNEITTDSRSKNSVQIILHILNTFLSADIEENMFSLCRLGGTKEQSIDGEGGGLTLIKELVKSWGVEGWKLETRR
jgi:hypothetical protein